MMEPYGMRAAMIAAGAALRAAVVAVLLWPLAAVAEGPPRVVATTGMIADVARTVAGGCVAIDQLMGPGIDPHLYKASAGDVHALQRADAILYSGYALEGQLAEVLARLAERKPTLAVAPSAAGEDEVISAANGYGIDPHLWMDASLWRRTVPVIASALAGLAPGCADAMRVRAREYGEQLDALHGWIARSVATIPERQRILVTAHDAFGYYGRAYGIRVVGIQGVSTESEAGVADIRAVADLVAEHGIPAIFIESTINPRTIRAVVEAVAQRGRDVAIGGQLHSDALGEEGTAGGTYVGMLYENTAAIVGALGGRAAPLPDALRPWAGAWNVQMAAD